MRYILGLVVVGFVLGALGTYIYSGRPSVLLARATGDAVKTSYKATSDTSCLISEQVKEIFFLSCGGIF